MKETSVERLKQQFPNPVTLHEGLETPGSYCVGASVLLSSHVSHDERGFPSEEELASALRIVNPCLDDDFSLAFAEDIICANDDKRFECAWDSLSCALEQGAR